MTNWRLRGNCLDRDPELFFSTAAGDQARAKAVCTGCIVRLQCLRAADLEEAELVDHKMVNGVRGGLTGMERWARRFPEEHERILEQKRQSNERNKEAKRKAYANMTPEQKERDRASKAASNKRRRLDPKYQRAEAARLARRKMATA